MEQNPEMPVPAGWAAGLSVFGTYFILKTEVTYDNFKLLSDISTSVPRITLFPQGTERNGITFPDLPVPAPLELQTWTHPLNN